METTPTTKRLLSEEYTRARAASFGTSKENLLGSLNSTSSFPIRFEHELGSGVLGPCTMGIWTDKDSFDRILDGISNEIKSMEKPARRDLEQKNELSSMESEAKPLHEGEKELQIQSSLWKDAPWRVCEQSPQQPSSPTTAATQLQIQQRVVAKRVLKSAVDPAIGLDGIRKYVQDLCHVRHPHLVPFLPAMETDKKLYVVRPYIPGRSLREAFLDSSSLTQLDLQRQMHAGHAIWVAKQIADACSHLVERWGAIGVSGIHTRNIFVIDGHAYLADYGLEHLGRCACDAGWGSALATWRLARTAPERLDPLGYPFHTASTNASQPGHKVDGRNLGDDELLVEAGVVKSGDGEFKIDTEAEGVFAFAMLLWQLVTGHSLEASLGQGLHRVGGSSNRIHPAQIAVSIAYGRRPVIPIHLPAVLADLLHASWAADAARRPSFRSICRVLDMLTGSQVPHSPTPPSRTLSESKETKPEAAASEDQQSQANSSERTAVSYRSPLLSHGGPSTARGDMHGIGLSNENEWVVWEKSQFQEALEACSCGRFGEAATICEVIVARRPDCVMALLLMHHLIRYRPSLLKRPQWIDPAKSLLHRATIASPERRLQSRRLLKELATVTQDACTGKTAVLSSYASTVYGFYLEVIDSDPVGAYNCYRKAALQPCPVSESNESVETSIEGLSISKDSEKVESMAESRGNPLALVDLACCFDTGVGCHADLVKAAEMYKQSALLGNVHGMASYGLCLKAGDGLEKDVKTAFMWLERAADAGSPLAQTTLARAYQKGISVTASGDGKELVLFARDESKAVHWYRMAADWGHAAAQCNLGVAYLEGRGVPLDSAMASMWFQRSAIQGNPDGQRNLGACYEDGLGVAVDVKKAIGWYRLAAESGDETASEILESLEKQDD
eukprot:TRINITY_DN6107_c0_g1_i1.p1 TRINITY_DN6107_c0_g1~~TRINITY_DN6107_c0_g1_i1.p1  ORF type:complete len:902 (+),score=176.96 TRINITY_DN6107_c0_g1_i1:68-2773(+)